MMNLLHNSEKQYRLNNGNIVNISYWLLSVSGKMFYKFMGLFAIAIMTVS